MSLNNISYWEFKRYFEEIDYLVIGMGLVGLSAAYHLKKKNPASKILVIERDVLPATASSKNAGFACFGSPSEIIEDLKDIPESEVWETLELRWKGLQELQKWLGSKEIDLQALGSWDLFDKNQQTKTVEIQDSLSTLNKRLKDITGHDDVFSLDNNKVSTSGFEGFESAFKNSLEGQIDTSKLTIVAQEKCRQLGIELLSGIELKSYSDKITKVTVDTSVGQFDVSRLIIATNGFSKNLLPNSAVEPARAQVLITNKIPGLKIKGTFHMEGGYYYFRNIDSRILLGGGRNMDFETEHTAEFGTSHLIQDKLELLLYQNILPNTEFKIERRWSGIMGVGPSKKPLVQLLSPRVSCGIRMGGMGIAIGTVIGQQLADLQD
jgi:gamma-glutamylputrescine oxidase